MLLGVIARKVFLLLDGMHAVAALVTLLLPSLILEDQLGMTCFSREWIGRQEAAVEWR